jgi:hypothetical protein
MERDRNIGRVLNVDSFRVLIEIDRENKSLTKTHYFGIYPIARINSYVIIPVGYEKIVGHITKVQMFTEANEPINKATITLPDVKRLIWATMIGTIKKKGEREYYEQGITSYPSLDNPVCFILKDELDIIFDKKTEYIADIVNDKGSYYIPIGQSTAFPEYEIKIDPDALFSKHLAILGNTGSGKSCTIASLIQTLLKGKYGDGKSKIENANFIILDTNGEYKNAFIKKSKDGKNFNIIGNCLNIDKEGLKIPYWFMNFEDFNTLFKATEGSQSPVLNTALVLAKEQIKGGSAPIATFILIGNSLRTIYDALLSDEEEWKRASLIKSTGTILYNLLKNNIEKINKYLTEKNISLTADNIVQEIIYSVNSINVETNEKTKKKYYRFKLEFDPSRYTNWYDKNAEIFNSSLLEFNTEQTKIDADMPIYFNKENFIPQYLYPAMNIEGKENSRIREYCATLILRMNTFFNDERYKILFDNYEDFPNALATFLRYCFGRMSNVKDDSSSESPNVLKTGSPPFLDYYNKIFKSPVKNHQIVIFDMSLLASDILENITALLGRLILEFLQRLGKDKEKRGTFPVVLVLEEAHNYIPEKKRDGEKESISKSIFERIAREGRKFGLSLVVSSQRPSELSKTVLSQCNSFIVHRIQNPEDQKYIQTIVPSINEDLLKQLPSLAQRTALIFGDCVRAPAQLYMNAADPLPDSKDPKFMEYWLKTDVEATEPDFEKICSEWEGKKIEE